MINTHFFKVHATAVLSIIFAILFAFRNLPTTFFQQDEWQYFGSIIYSILSSNPIANILLPLQGQITHFFPFATATFLIEYLLFKMNFSYYVFMNIFVHSANAMLVYFLISRLTAKKFLAWGSALLFSVNSIAHQPITWVAAGIGTLQGTFFLLLFFIYLVLFHQSRRGVMLAGAFLSLLISVLFKETSIFVFLFLPLLWFIAKTVYHSSMNVPKWAVLSFFALASFYIVIRIFFLIVPVRSAQSEIGDVTTASAEAYAYRFITVPIKAFPQSLIPFPILSTISRVTMHLAYPQFIATDGIANPYIAEGIVFDLVCLLGSILLLLLSFHVYQVLKKINKKISLVFGASVLFILISAIPYIFVPGRAGFFSIFEPRNLYVIGIGSSVWVSLVLYAFVKKPWFVFFVMLITLFHIFSIQKDIAKLVDIGFTRENFLVTVEAAYPKLSQQVVFFTQSDTSYYGLPVEEKILPLQSGFGRMLMVWYQDTEHFPRCMYEDSFLHGIKAEGYRSCGGRGIGYFRQYDTLLAAIREHKFSPDAIIAYNWDSKKEKFSEITDEIRLRITNDLNK